MKKYFNHYNDFELIEYVKQGNEQAFEVMVEKYSKFISKKIHKFNLAYEYDDLYQEGLTILYRSIIVFDDSFNKTFTRFFEMNYERHLISFIRLKKSRTHIEYIHQEEIKENNHIIKEPSFYFRLYLDEIKKILTPLEHDVYILREVKNYTIEAISKTLDIEVKSVYNSCHRAKDKIRVHFKE